MRSTACSWGEWFQMPTWVTTDKLPTLKSHNQDRFDTHLTLSCAGHAIMPWCGAHGYPA
jgi:hypothetical protein